MTDCCCVFKKKNTYIYIYIYIYWQHFFVDTNFIKHNTHFMSTYFLLDTFEFPYCFYRIREEWIYALSIVLCIPSTSNGSRRKYVHIKCLLCLMKFVSMKKCCQNIHILNSMILKLINITALCNTNVISRRDELHSILVVANTIIFNGKDALT